MLEAACAKKCMHSVAPETNEPNPTWGLNGGSGGIIALRTFDLGSTSQPPPDMSRGFPKTEKQINASKTGISEQKNDTT